MRKVLLELLIIHFLLLVVYSADFESDVDVSPSDGLRDADVVHFHHFQTKINEKLRHLTLIETVEWKGSALFHLNG